MQVQITTQGVTYRSDPDRVPPSPAVTRKPGILPSWVPSRPIAEVNSTGRLASVDEVQRLDSLTPSFQGCIAIAEGELSQLRPVSFNLEFPPQLRERHLLAVGKTGSGKTSRVILPLIWSDILDRTKTVIVLDAKGDLTAPVLEMIRLARGRGAKVRYISFAEPQKSLAWNPIHKISSDEEIYNVVNAISPRIPPNCQSDPIWRTQAQKVVAGLIKEFAKYPEANSIGYLTFLMAQSRLGIAEQFDKYRLPETFATEALLQENVTAYGIKVEAQSLVESFGTADVATTTSSHEFEFDELLKPMVLILRFPEGVPRLQELHAAFVRKLFSWVTDTANSQPTNRLPTTVSCFLDEFASSLGQIPDIERALSTFRSRNFYFTAAIQQAGQLENIYGGLGSVIYESFGTLMSIPPVSETDARLASIRSGALLWNRVTTSGDVDGQILGEEFVTREVLLPREISMPPRHPDHGSPATVILPEHFPFQVFLKPIWKYPEFNSWDRAQGGDMPQGGYPNRKTKIDRPSYL